MTRKNPLRFSAQKRRRLLLERWDKKHVWHPFTQQTEWEKEETVIVDSARGRYFRDLRGRRFLDGVSSLWVTTHGHREPALDRAVRAQLGRMAHTTFLGLSHEPAVRLARELVDFAPRGLTRVFFSDNGATAVEVALKMAFQAWAQSRRPAGAPPRTEFLALDGAYHGDTLGAASVGGLGVYHKVFRPLLFKARFAMSPNCHACPRRRKPLPGRFRVGTGPERVRTPRPGDPRPETGCRWECLADAEEKLGRHGPRLAAAVVEPVVQGAAGMVVAPPGYLKGFARLCRRRGVPLIADEVATGFGRTGPLFAVEREGVTPDFLCVAKSLTGGYLPLAATLTRESVHRRFRGRYDAFKTFFHGHTYTANPLACAAARANLALYRRRGWPAALAPRIAQLRAALEPLSAHPLVGDVRQAGLMAGIELVRDKATGRPFAPAVRAGARVCRAARRHGVWIRPLGDVVVLLPPLGITAAELRRLTSAVRSALDDVAREFSEGAPA